MEVENDKKITVNSGSLFGGSSSNLMSVQIEEARKLVKQIKATYPKYFETEKRILNVTNNLVSWEGIDSKAYKENIQNYLTHTKHQVEYIVGLFDLIDKYINQVEDRVMTTKVMFEQIN